MQAQQSELISHSFPYHVINPILIKPLFRPNWGWGNQIKFIYSPNAILFPQTQYELKKGGFVKIGFVTWCDWNG